MTWALYAIVAAILVSATTLIEKKTLQGEHAMEFSTIFAIVNCCLSLPFFVVIDYSRLSVSSMLILFLNSILGAISLLYTAKALRHMDVSSSAPLYVIAPALTALLATLFLGEHLSPMQTTGLGLLVVGAYILELRHKNIFEPFKVFKDSRYVHYVLLSIGLMSISSIVDRWLLHAGGLQPEAYTAFVHLFLAIIFFCMFTYSYGNIRSINNGMKQYGWSILLIGVLTIAHRYAQIQSLALAYVGLVVAVKRSSTLFITLIGGKLFHEGNLFIKTLASLIMIAGMLLIVL